MRVRLYRNLAYSKQRAWSLVADEGARKGKVIDVVDGAVLQDATFYVSEAGRQYVIKTQKKKVHAWVIGDLVKSYPLDTLPKTADGNDIAPGKHVTARIGYDPYKYKHMFREDCHEYVETAPLVVAAPKGVYADLGHCTGRGLRGLGLGAAIVPTSVDGWNG